MNFKSVFIFSILVLFFSSCNSYKKMTYLKDVESLTVEQKEQIKESYVPNKIRTGDMLTIFVNVVNSPTSSLPFNLPLMPTAGTGTGTIQNTVGSQYYLVDEDGNINFPVLGKLSVKGLTRTELENMIKGKIYPKYLTEEPIITVRYINKKISVLGEVNRPGVYAYTEDRLDLLSALALAGDLTIFGKRDNVLLRRITEDGGYEFIRLNLQDKNIVSSPYFQLQQNDVIYVEPNKSKGNSSAIGSTEGMVMSIISTLISVATLLITVFKY